MALLFKLVKMLKFRLAPWKNEDYWKWCSSQRRDGWEWHHLLGRKYSNLFVVMIPKIDHERIHHGSGYLDGEFETLFIESLINIMRYIDDK